MKSGNVKLKYLQTDYLYTYDDEKILNEILESKISGEKLKRIIINPYALSSLIFTIVFLQIFQIKDDLEKVPSEMPNMFREGQKVRLNGSRSIGIVKEVKPNKDIIIQYTDLTLTLPFKLIKRLNIYQGDAGITKYSYRPNKKVQKVSNFFSNLFDLGPYEISTVFMNKTMVICDRFIFEQHFKNLSINNFNVTDVIPTGYYPNAKKFVRLGRDFLQRKPLICFASNLFTALKIIEHDNHFKNVVVFGTKKLKGNMVYLDEIQNNKRINNIFLVCDILDVDFDMIEKTKKMGFNLNNTNLSESEEKNILNNIKRLPHRITNPFEEKKIIVNRKEILNTKQILVHSKADSLMQDLYSKLNNIIKNMESSNPMIIIIRKLYGFIKHLRTLPLSLKEQQRINEFYPYKDILNELENNKYNVIANSALDYQLYLEIVEDIEELINFHFDTHPKEKTFSELAKTLTSSDCIVVNDRRHIEFIKKWLMDKFNYFNINILTVSQLLKENIYFNKIVVLGWYDKDIFKLRFKCVGIEESHILYEFEKEVEDYMYNKSEIKKLYEKLDTNITTVAEDHFQMNDKDGNQLINNMELLLENVKFANYNYKNLDQGISSEKATCVYFEEGCYAFLTEGYICRVLDRNSENIIKKKLIDLEKGDELVFIETNDDVFNEIINRIRKNSQKVNMTYSYAELWKKALKDYISNFQLTPKDVSKRLKRFGFNRHPVTISNWIHDETVIGTDEIVDAIAELTKDEKLIRHLDRVKKSCKKVRALHIRIGRYLARVILGTLTNENEKEMPLIKDLVRELSGNIRIVTVSIIDKEKIEVPVHQINKLLDQ